MARARKPLGLKTNGCYRPIENGLNDFDKDAFKRFRRSHPTLTNQEAMSMFKLNHGHSRHMGMSHGL